MPYEVLEAESEGIEPSCVTTARYSTPVADHSAPPSLSRQHLRSPTPHRPSSYVLSVCFHIPSSVRNPQLWSGRSRDRTVALADGAG